MKKKYRIIIIYGLIFAIVIGLIFTVVSIYFYNTDTKAYYHLTADSTSFSAGMFLVAIVVYYITKTLGWTEWDENFFTMWIKKE